MTFRKSKIMIPCMVCGQETPYQKTNLPSIERSLKKGHPEARCYGEGWTKNVRENWACRECVRSGKALRANPLEQNFMGYSGPFFAYSDRTRTCVYCGTRFNFSAGEQQYWYEKAKFHPSSVPIGCADCRKVLREHKKAQRELREALEHHDESDWESWRVLSGLYLKLRCQSKALEALRRAKNLCRDAQAVQQLQDEIGELQSMTIEALPEWKWEYKITSLYER